MSQQSIVIPRKDLTNQTFGDLIVIKLLRSENYNRVWLCSCTCGNTCEKRSDQLSAKNTAKHCGCKHKPAELIGQRFGKLLVIDYARTSRGSYGWKCLCDCGKETTQETSSLTTPKKRTGNPNTSSCGCSLGSFGINLLGRTFGTLTVIKELPVRLKNKEWLCQCSCGNTCTPTTTALVKGATESCGCKKKEYFRQYRISKGKNPDISMQIHSHYLRGRISGTKKKIRDRDNNKCVLCLTPQSKEIPLFDHHIIPMSVDETLYASFDNRILLCGSCHLLAHNNNWQKFDSSIQKILQQVIEWYKI